MLNIFSRLNSKYRLPVVVAWVGLYCTPFGLAEEQFDKSIPMLATHWAIRTQGSGGISFDASNGMLLQPRFSEFPIETHSALVLCNDTLTQPLKDFQLTVQAGTLEQLREPQPNSWEVLSIFFNFVVDASGNQKTNYFRFTKEGIELGTLSGKNSQNFLATSQKVQLRLGNLNTFILTKRGGQLEISLDGDQVINFTSIPEAPPLFDFPGAIGFYVEDAKAQVVSVQIRTP
jgi:hypothetical protein